MMMRHSHGRKSMVIGLAALAALSGCRFGNYTQASKDGQAPTLEGWYQSEPQTLTFCAGLSSGTVCKDAATNLIPSLISAHMTNPVGLNLGTSNVGIGEFVSSVDPGQRLGTNLEEGGIINDLLGGSDVFWDDQACMEDLYLQEKGAVKTEAGKISGVSTIGRISVQFEYIDDIHGNCADSLAKVQACYRDVTQCGGADAGENRKRQQYVQNHLNPFIDAGVITVNDIPNVLNLGYTVSYQ